MVDYSSMKDADAESSNSQIFTDNEVVPDRNTIPSADSQGTNGGGLTIDPNTIEMTNAMARPLISGIMADGTVDADEEGEEGEGTKAAKEEEGGRDSDEEAEEGFGMSADEFHDCGDGIGRCVNEADYEPSDTLSGDAQTHTGSIIPPLPAPTGDGGSLPPKAGPPVQRSSSIFQTITDAFSPTRNKSVATAQMGAIFNPEESAFKDIDGFENRDPLRGANAKAESMKLGRCKTCGELISRDIEEVEKHMDTCVGYLMKTKSTAAPLEKAAHLSFNLITASSMGTLPRRPELANSSTRIIYRTSRSPNTRFRPREVCALQDAFRDADGSYYSYEVSVRHCDVRGMPGYVTADVLLLLHVAKPVKGSKSTCQITIISQVDTRAKGGMLMSLVQNEGKKKVGAMNRADLVRELETSGNLQDILKREQREDEEGQIVSLDDFELLAVLGRGGFGKVMQVKHKTTGKVYAMKILKKTELRRRKQVERTQTERSILAAVKHPFIVCLHYAFQNPSKLYMVMDFVQGGDFFTLMRKFRKMPEDWTRLYIAEIALALQHLHDMDVVYRDLKPENILLCGDGHLKLTDFGLSRYFEMRPPAPEDIVGDKPLTKSFCGTEQYMSPEMLLQQGHNFRMDWWCVGLLMHEMLSARHPFHGPSHYDTLRNMVTKQPVIDSKLGPTASSCVRALLIKNPRARLCSNGGINELKAHPFFAPCNWDDVFNKRVRMNYVPEISGDTDISSFEATFTRFV
jgi:tRNA A-37 threonylcarbamoyl transferase component Bud32